ncbi:MAG: hypothetical protein AB1814_18325 [Thermodesulfobacteriota bacterium]
MEQRSIECVLINPGDFDSYLPTIKLALLHYDKIHLIPRLDAIFPICSVFPSYINNIMPSVLQKMQEYAVGYAAQEMLKIMNTPELSVAELANLPSKIQDHFKPIANRLIKEKFDRKKVEDLVGTEVKETWDKISLFEQKVKCLLEENLISFPTAQPEISKLSIETGKSFSQSFLPVIENAYASVFRGNISQVPSAETVSYGLWASEAAAMVELVNAPLMSTSSPFLHRLQQQLTTGNGARWLGSGNAKSEWKAQRLSLALCDTELPSTTNISFEDIIEVRRLAGDVLGPYRNAVASFASSLKCAPWDKDLESEAQQMIEKEIQPALGEVAKLFRKHAPISKILKKAYSGTKEAWDRISVVADFFPQAEPFVILAAAGEGLQAAVEEYFTGQREETNQNGLLFFIKARSILESRAG